MIAVLSRTPSPRALLLLTLLWAALPSIPLSMHECHGFVGFLAHSPLYAFLGVSVLLTAIAALALVRSVKTPRP